MLREQFLKEIEAFLAASGMPKTTLGKQAMGDASFVSRLREGRDVKVGTIEHVRRWMHMNRHLCVTQAAAE